MKDNIIKNYHSEIENLRDNLKNNVILKKQNKSDSANIKIEPSVSS